MRARAQDPINGIRDTPVANTGNAVRNALSLDRSSAAPHKWPSTKALQQEFGFTVDNVVASAKALLQAHGT